MCIVNSFLVVGLGEQNIDEEDRQYETDIDGSGSEPVSETSVLKKVILQSLLYSHMKIWWATMHFEPISPEMHFFGEIRVSLSHQSKPWLIFLHSAGARINEDQ